MLVGVGCVVAALAAAAPTAAAQARATTAAKTRAEQAKLARAQEARALTLEDRLTDDLRSIWAGANLRRGTTAVYVVDATTGEKLFAVHEDRPLNVASNVKLVSTATALHILGPDWRYVTQLLGPTPEASGDVRGSIYLFGNADPTLRAKHLANFAAELLARGVKRIDGDIVVGDAPLRDTLGRSSVTIKVTGTSQGKAPAVSIEPPNALVTADVHAVTNDKRRRSRVSASGTWVEDELGERFVVKVTGPIQPGTTRTFHRRVPKRNLYAAHVLRGALVDAGIEVTGAVRVVNLDAYVGEAVQRGYLPVELTRRESAPVSELVAWVNKPSNNFLADRLLMTAGAVRYGGAPDMDKGVAAMNEWMKAVGIDVGSVVLDTGSGLSYQTKLSSHQIVQVLRAAAGYAPAPDPLFLDAEPNLLASAVPTGGGVRGGFTTGLDVDTGEFTGVMAPDIERFFYDSLAVAGVDGTLRRRFKRSAAQGNCYAKTGTLTQVIALSGFVTAGDGHTLAFALVTNGHNHRRRNVVRSEHQRLVEAMMRYLEARKARAAAVAPSPAPAPGAEVTAAAPAP